MHNSRRTSLRNIMNQSAAWLRVLAIAIVLGPIVGCGESDKEPRLGRRTLDLTEVPEEIRSAAAKRLPDVEFSDAWKNLDRDGKLHSYEIRGKNKDGKTREARVSPTGEILEVE